MNNAAKKLYEMQLANVEHQIDGLEKLREKLAESVANAGVGIELPPAPSPMPNPQPSGKAWRIWNFEDGRDHRSGKGCPIPNVITTTINGPPSPLSVPVIQPLGRMTGPISWDFHRRTGRTSWLNMSSKERKSRVRAWAESKLSGGQARFGLGVDPEDIALKTCVDIDPVLCEVARKYNKNASYWPKADLEHHTRDLKWSYKRSVEHVNKCGFDHICFWRYDRNFTPKAVDASIDRWFASGGNARPVVVIDGQKIAFRNRGAYSGIDNELRVIEWCYQNRSDVDLGFFYLFRDGFPNDRASRAAELFKV